MGADGGAAGARGAFASCGGPFRLADPAVEAAVQAARAPYLASDEIPSPDGTPEDHPMRWPGTELRRSPWFTDVRQCVIGRRLAIRAEDYVGYLSTVSAYLELPEPQRQEVYRRIERVLPATVELAADVIVHLARRR